MKKIQHEIQRKLWGTNAKHQRNGSHWHLLRKWCFKSEFINNSFRGQWEIKGMEGLVEFTLTGDTLEGNWKKGLEPGPMKGKWELVVLISSIENAQSSEDSEVWDIDSVTIRDILFTSCDGISGQDVALITSSFKPVADIDRIIYYLNHIFSDDDVNYLFKYKKYPDGEIILYASTYLLRLGGDVFEKDIDEYSNNEIMELLKNNGINKKIFSFQYYLEEG